MSCAREKYRACELNGEMGTTENKEQKKIEVKPNYPYIFKILIIGNPGTGKTNLLRLIENPDECSQRGPCLDFGIKTIIVREQRVKLQIWDPGISEKCYLSILSLLFIFSPKISEQREPDEKFFGLRFYRGVDGILLCLDLSKSKTELESQTTFWKEEMENYFSKERYPKVILVGTH